MVMSEGLKTEARITGGFWKQKQDMIAKDVIYRQLEILSGGKDGLRPGQESHVIENFQIAAGRSNAPYQGYVYSDSELGKWMEAAAYSLKNVADQKLEGILDSLVELVTKAQMPDGYVNTYFQVLRPESRLKHFAFSCELYNMGHLMEASAAFYEVTGKSRFLEAMCRAGDFLCGWAERPENRHVYDGHAEIELGLTRLYQVTGRRRYLELAEHFIRERGRRPCFFLEEEPLGDNDTGANDFWFGPDHHQAHKPVTEQRTAEGHAVKLVYLYSGVADLVREGLDPDHSLEKAMLAVWENMTARRMYVTGGIGSQGYAERFTGDYDLPGDRGYLETCASVGVCFWADRMLRLYRDGRYGDTFERALYNGVLAGWSLDGNSYFYTNTLHYKRGISDYREDCRHLEKERQLWFRCACCPSNILRLVAKLQEYAWMYEEGIVYVNLYIQGELRVTGAQKDYLLQMDTDYPWDGEVRIRVHSFGERGGVSTGRGPISALALRIPSWCRSFAIEVNGRRMSEEEMAGQIRQGYLYLYRLWRDQDEICLRLDMSPGYLFSNGQVWENSGRAVLARGPLIYCLESTDQEGGLAGIYYDVSQVPSVENGSIQTDHGVKELKYLEGKAFRLKENGKELYTDMVPEMEECRYRAIPYFAWGNRGECDMDVWVPMLCAKHS